MKNTKIILLTGILFGLAGMQLEAKEDKHANHKKAEAYPLTTCVVSDEPLGEMGEAYIYEYEGREVRFCCKGCKKDFLKEPQKFLSKLDAAKADKAKEASGDKKGHMGGNHHADSKSSKDVTSGTSDTKNKGHEGHHH